MAINDDQIEDLQQTTILGDDDKVVESPSILPQDKQKLTVIPETEELQHQAVTLTKEYEAKLPMMDTQLKLVDGNQSRLVDMEDVESVIAGKGTADQGTADSIHEVFEELYTPSLTRNHFTAAPTKTNFPRLVTHMKNRIALEEQEMVKNVAAAMREPVDDAIAIMTEMKDKYLPALHGCYGGLYVKAEQLDKTLEQAQNTIVLVEGEFIDLQTLPLDNVEKLSGVAAFDKLREELKKYFEDSRARTNYFMISYNRSLSPASTREAILEFVSEPVTISNMIRYYRNPAIFEFASAIGESIDTTVGNMQKHKAATTDIATTSFPEVKEYVETNGAELVKLAQYHVEIVAHMNKLIELNCLAEKMFDFFLARINVK